MKKLFEMYGVRGDPEQAWSDFLPEIMDTMTQALDDLIQQGHVKSPDNVHMSAFHDEPCAGVAAKSFDLCTCEVVRFEVYSASRGDVALNMASGTTVPYGMVGRDEDGMYNGPGDDSPEGEMN